MAKKPAQRPPNMEKPPQPPSPPPKRLLREDVFSRADNFKICESTVGDLEKALKGVDEAIRRFVAQHEGMVITTKLRDEFTQEISKIVGFHTGV